MSLKVINEQTEKRAIEDIETSFDIYSDDSFELLVSNYNFLVPEPLPFLLKGCYDAGVKGDNFTCAIGLQYI